MLSGQKDTDFIILSKLNDKDLLSVCVTNKYANRLCNNEDFWRSRFISKWGSEYMKYNTDKTWKRFYLLIIKYLNGGEEWDTGMKNAAEGGDKDLVGFFIAKGAYDWDWGMYGAALGGHQDLVDFFIGKGANRWEFGLDAAALKGHRNLVELFISKGASGWGSGMLAAASGGHKDLVEFFIAKGVNEWELGMMYASRGGHRDLVEFFIAKGAKDWNDGMYGAALGGHRDLVELFIAKGANFLNTGMKYAAEGGHRDLVDFFIAKGANDWESAMYAAMEGGHQDLVEFFKGKIMGGKNISLSPSMQRLGKMDTDIEKYLKNPPKSWKKMFLEQGLSETPTIKQVLTLLDKTAGGNSSQETETSVDNPKNFTPPENVRKEAMEGIRLSYENNYPSYNGIGLARAIQLVVEPKIWKRSVDRMRAFFKRNHRFSDFSPTSKAYMAYLNWGGASGEKWVENIV